VPKSSAFDEREGGREASRWEEHVSDPCTELLGCLSVSGNECVIGFAELAPNAPAGGVEERRGRPLDVIRSLGGVRREKGAWRFWSGPSRATPLSRNGGAPGAPDAPRPFPFRERAETGRWIRQGWATRAEVIRFRRRAGPAGSFPAGRVRL